MPCKKLGHIVLIVMCLVSFLAIPRHALGGGVAGEPWVFGQNFVGQLGIGIMDAQGTPNPVPSRPIGVGRVIKGGFGNATAAILMADGTVMVCGSSHEGTLGDMKSIITDIFVPVAGLDNVIDLTVGFGRYYAAKNDGTVWAGGGTWVISDTTGEEILVTEPRQVEGLSNVVSVSVSGNGLFALKRDGTVWGLSYTHTQFPKPVQVEGLSNIVAITAGEYHGIALGYDGRVWTWGSNNFGQLGTGNRRIKHTPHRVQGLKDVVAIAAGKWHSVALKSNGTIWTWGSNYRGQSGVKIETFNTRPVKVNIRGRATTIAAGLSATYFIDEAGSLWAFGANESGQLGDGTTESSRKPVKAVGLENVIGVYSGVGAYGEDYGSVLAITAPPQATAK